MNTLKIKSVIITAVAAIMLLMVSNVSNAQNQNRLRTKNIRIADRAYAMGDSELACEYLSLEILMHPRNGYAYFYLGCIIVNDGNLFAEIGNDVTIPIQCFDVAISLLPRWDKKTINSASMYRMICYEYLNSTIENVSYNTEEVFY